MFDAFKQCSLLIKKHFSVIILFVSSSIVLWMNFFISNGTFFLLDGIFFPYREMKGFFEISLVWHAIDIGKLLFWYILFSKIYYFSIVFFTGLLGYKFGSLFTKIFKQTENQTFIESMGIIFFLINPFFYERMLTQPWVMLGSLFLGYGIYFLVTSILNNSSSRHILLAGIFFGLSLSVMTHALFMVSLVMWVYLLLFVRAFRQMLDVIFSGLLFLVLNLNWLLGNFFLHTGNTLSTIWSFNQENIANFTTHWLLPLSPSLSTLFLYGFWWENWGHFLLPTSNNQHWYIAGWIILLLILLGAWKSIKFPTTRRLWIFLSIIGFVSFILAVWVVAPWWDISQFLYDYLPLYIGMREPHKWTGILMIVYGIFFIISMIPLIKFISTVFVSPYWNSITACIIFLFLNAWSPNVLFWFNHQFVMTDYPKDYETWYQQEIQTSTQNNTYLLLPWHSYIACDWTRGKVIPNAMGDYWKPLNVIVSDNIEVGSLYTNSREGRSKDIETFLTNKDFSLLKKRKITDIIFINQCADYLTYQDLLKKSSQKWLLTPNYQWPSLEVYHIR